MSISVDDATNLSVMIMRGNPDWLVSMATGPDGASEKNSVTKCEFAGMRWDRSLIETEILVTAWLAGRGFVLRAPWRTTKLTGGESGVFQTEAEFIRQ